MDELDVQDSIRARNYRGIFTSSSVFENSVFENSAGDYSLRWDAFDSWQAAFG
jgi:hypothetical protein